MLKLKQGFNRKKQETHFLVTQKRDDFYGILKNHLPGGHAQKTVLDKIESRYQKIISRVLATDRKNFAFLLVLKVNEAESKFLRLHLAGLAHCADGFTHFDSDLLVLKTYRPSHRYALADEWWSEGLFWSQFVRYAFRKQTFGGLNLKAVQEEQMRTGVTTNRNGFANGRTWADQQATASASGRGWRNGEMRDDTPDLLFDRIGLHKADADPEGVIDARSGALTF